MRMSVHTHPCVHASKSAERLESAVRMHSRDQRLLQECALNLGGLVDEIVLCFHKYMLSLEQRIAVDQSVCMAAGFCSPFEGGISIIVLKNGGAERMLTFFLAHCFKTGLDLNDKLMFF